MPAPGLTSLEPGNVSSHRTAFPTVPWKGGRAGAKA